MPNTQEWIDTLFKKSGKPCIELNGTCQKCKGKVQLVIFKKDMEVSGNGGVVIGDQWDSRPEFKCSKCLEEDGGMINPTRCEVFSRVCGYLRPTQSFNPGKKREFEMRKNFLTNGCEGDREKNKLVID